MHYRVEVYIPGSRSLKLFGQLLHANEKQASPPLLRRLSKLEKLQWPTGELSSMKYRVFCILVTDLPIKSSTTSSGFHKVCARSAPRELTTEHKCKPVEIWQCLLDRYNNESEESLSRIVTGVHHYAPKSKRQSKEWKHPGSPATKKLNTQSSARKVMLTFLWDLKGPILEDYPENECTINSEGTVNCWPTIWGLQVAPNAEAYNRRKFCCCMITHAYIRPAVHTVDPNRVLNWWISLPTVQISCFEIIISFDCSHML